MNDGFKNFGIIILAAGQGKRLGCTDCPKVLLEIGGRPMVSYILETLETGGVPKENICLVVGFQAEKMKEKLGPGYIYATQDEQLGTAHAAHIGEEALPDNFKQFVVIQGDDSAFYKFDTLKNFLDFHLAKDNDMTLLTCEAADPSLLGRIIRDKEGRMTAIVEKENATEEQKKIKEISTNTFCFEREWFNKIYPELKPIPRLNELGITAFIEEAEKRGAKYDGVKLPNPDEWFGINTPEQLKEADRRKMEIAKI
jgi:bifunctional UDP-N-acetylglucosamine pyrophosphorylase/glucosamine-1-phosphate N-acetyltransferase